MKKLYSIVLMAAALLVGTNAWATMSRADLQAAIDGAASGATITLQDNVSLDGPIWLGTEAINGTAKTVILDLHGYNVEMNANSSAGYMFVLTHGELKIVNNAAQASNITLKNGNASSQIFSVYGHYRSSRWNADGTAATPTNTRVSGYFSHLEIGKNVNIIADAGCLGTGIAVDAIAEEASNKTNVVPQIAARLAKGLSGASNKPIQYHTTIVKIWDPSKSAYASRGFAYGARVDVYGNILINGQDGADKKAYGIKTNGNLANSIKGLVDSHESPVANGKNPVDEAYLTNYNALNHDLDTIDAPFVYVHKGSNLETNKASDRSAAVYASGYAKWLIEGTCQGNIGVSASSGAITVNNATIKSTSETYSAPTGEGGVSGSGSAIVVNSRDAYAGGVEMTVSGDSHVSAESGYAIQETVNTTIDPSTGKKETKVEGIVITGGTFEGGENPATGEQQPAIIVSAQTKNDENTEVIVYGGNIDGTFVVEGNEGTNVLDEVVPATAHTTEIVMTDPEDPTKTITVTVVSQGAAPTGDDDVAEGHDKNSSVKWTGTAETLTADLELKELEITDGNATAHKAQVLTIGDDTHNVTVKIGRIVLGEEAQIIVNPGSKLIVTGEQGFVSNKVSNFVLKHNSTTGKYATFLFNPAVTSNKHPNATVEFTTNSWRESSSALQWEWFGIPTYNKAKSITSTGQAYVAVYENGGWTNLGFIGGTDNDNPAVLAKLDMPFAAYDLLANRAKDVAAPEITISGELVGNADGALNANLRWSPFANSYTAELDAEAFVNALKGSSNIADAIYVATQNANGTITWNVKTGPKVEGLKLQPMQAFLLNNPNNIEETAINYASMVYAPATSTPNSAPRRAAINYSAMVTINVANEEGTWDDVDLLENEDVKSYEKYLNNDVNIYVVDNQKNDYIAVEDLENTYVGFSTVKGGKYTINFENVAGRELALVDHETGAQVAMVEGNTYEFTAAANSANDYRFEIVGAAKLPTAIENTEAVKSAKGVYTITGQYVGEMNVWNTLPAGIYVVNGEKRVK